MLENIYYKTGLKDSNGERINIGSRIIIRDLKKLINYRFQETYGTVFFDGEYFIKIFGKNQIIKFDKKLLKKYQIEVIK